MDRQINSSLSQSHSHDHVQLRMKMFIRIATRQQIIWTSHTEVRVFSIGHFQCHARWISPSPVVTSIWTQLLNLYEKTNLFFFISLKQTHTRQGKHLISSCGITSYSIYRIADTIQTLAATEDTRQLTIDRGRTTADKKKVTNLVNPHKFRHFFSSQYCPKLSPIYGHSKCPSTWTEADIILHELCQCGWWPLEMPNGYRGC